MTNDELRGAMAVISAINDHDNGRVTAMSPLAREKFFSWMAGLSPDQVQVSFDIYLAGQPSKFFMKRRGG